MIEDDDPRTAPPMPASYDHWKAGGAIDLPSALPGRFQCTDCGTRTNLDYSPCGTCGEPAPHPLYDPSRRPAKRIRYWRIACACGRTTIVTQAPGTPLPSGHCRVCGSHQTRAQRATSEERTDERRAAAQARRW